MRAKHTQPLCTLHGRLWTEGREHRSGSKAQYCIDVNKRSRRASSPQQRSRHESLSTAINQLLNTASQFSCNNIIILCITNKVAVWLSGNALVSIDEVYYTSGLVSTWMGDHLRMGKPSQYVTSHLGQLSLAIPPWVGAMSTSESWRVNGHTT